MELSHARRINDHAALWRKIISRHEVVCRPLESFVRTLHRCLDIFSIEAIDQARLANTRSADEHGRVAGFDHSDNFFRPRPVSAQAASEDAPPATRVRQPRVHPGRRINRFY